MSIENPTPKKQTPERDRPVLVDNPETGLIDVMRTTGDSYVAYTLDNEAIRREGVGSGSGEALRTEAIVTSSSLEPQAQEQLARELQREGIPLYGDTVNALLDEKRNEKGEVIRQRQIVPAKITDYAIENGQRKIQVTSETKEPSTDDLAIWASIEAVMPGVQAQMEKDRLEQDKYDVSAQEIITEAPNLDSTRLYYRVQNFLEGILSDVDQGKVTLGGEVATRDTFKRQMNLMLSELNTAPENRKNDPFMRMPRMGAMRTAFRGLMGDPKSLTYQPLMDAMTAMKDKDAEKASTPSGSVVVESKLEAKREESLEEQIAKLPIEAQRAITDYVTYMSQANFYERANGSNRDSQEYRRLAEQAVHTFPRSVGVLAKRSYEKESQQQ